MITGEKILITGASGIVGQPIARHLAASNEVWGIARFAESDKRDVENYRPATGGDPERGLSTRKALDEAGVVTRSTTSARASSGICRTTSPMCSTWPGCAPISSISRRQCAPTSKVPACSSSTAAGQRQHS